MQYQLGMNAAADCLLSCAPCTHVLVGFVIQQTGLMSLHSTHQVQGPAYGLLYLMMNYGCCGYPAGLVAEFRQGTAGV